MKKILYKGPDISYHNGNVDIKRVRDAGYRRVGIRCGYGKNNIDQKFAKNALACVNLGELVMLYWFSYALDADMAAQEARYCIAQAAKYWKSCPIAFDLEYDTVRYARTKGVNIEKKLATNMAIAFLKEVKEAGYIPVLYTNKDYTKNYFDIERIQKEVGHVYVWYARYTGSLPAAEENIPDIWQYTSKGRIDGVTGNVDMNNFFTNFVFESEESVQQPATYNINILNFQKAANADGYKDQLGQPLGEDGIDGAKTQYVRRKILLKMNGLRVGSTGEVVKWVQIRLNEILECNLKIDGRYGSRTKNAVKQFQKKYGLATDGKAGYTTIQGMFYN